MPGLQSKAKRSADRKPSAAWSRSGLGRNQNEVQLDQQHEGPRLYHRGAFVHPLGCFVAKVLLNDPVESGLKAKK
jgi:hypothetical protein